MNMEKFHIEENHKRIMSQYDECVKENNNLKAQQKADIISLNGETDKKIVTFAKDNEKINGEITRKNLEYNALIKDLKEKRITRKKILKKMGRKKRNMKVIQIMKKKKKMNLKKMR